MNGVGEWLHMAREDLAVARLALEHDLIASAAYHTQQAIEKILKAALIASGVRPLKTHDLEALAALSDEGGCPFQPSELTHVTGWVVSGRYPGFDDDLPGEDVIETFIGRANAWLGTLT